MLKKIACFTALFALAGISLQAEELITDGVDAKGAPKGWILYGKGPGLVKVENKMIHITDQSAENEWGIRKTLPITGSGKYTFTLDGACTVAGAQMVAVVRPVGQTKSKVIGIKQVPVTGAADKFQKTAFTVDVPENCDNIVFHIYSQYQPMADFIIRSIDFAQAK